MTTSSLKAGIRSLSLGRHVGRINRVAPGYLRSDGPLCAPGDLCVIKDSGGLENGVAEVVALDSGIVSLMPMRQSGRIRPGDRVELLPQNSGVAVGDVFISRLVDALGNALDGDGDLLGAEFVAPGRAAPMPLARAAEAKPFDTGVKSIDAIMPLAHGQRIGVFAAAGVGKTTLLTQIARQADCDHSILCLVGERGREVEAMWASICDGRSTASHSAIVATSDEPAALRVRAVEQAIAMAEHWRDRGKHVVFVMDSVTRYAMALREIGLVAGLPPTLRSYTPNVFSALPRLVERCGALKSGGSITGVFSVLSETDDVDDPIVEAMKSFLDGHLILSRDLAEAGHFPAIDITASISRLAPELMGEVDRRSARLLVSALSTLKRSRLLIESGMYQAGSDPLIDRAIGLRSALDDFLKQDSSEFVPSRAARTELSSLMVDHVHE